MPITVINPGFKYNETRKPNKVLTGTQSWQGDSVNGITGLSTGSWSVNTGIGLKTSQLPKRKSGNTFSPYHG